ncbi:ABC transporter ATP-binding protein [Microbispora hainanensis]|uniref:ABC transporter ATP-binding protein n=1 Tax=Microbispora hainanensis TaxID=568844 RepID=UPI002E2A6D8A|nr:ABC transporter ATP-binding protein [Microbispora hainanensis]
MTAALTIRDLRVAYGRIEVVHGVSFEAATGRVTCLLGANGAGKTTTIRGLLGLQADRSGVVKVGDTDVSRHEAHKMAGFGIAYVPEGRRVFARLSVRDNLRMGAATRPRSWRSDDELDRVLGTFPELADRLDAPAGLLSGGQQQMLAIGRALMARPTLLILDEPSMGLSPKLVTRIYQALARLRDEGHTILLVEQNAKLALDLADHAYVLETGRIAESGPAADLSSSTRVRDIYLGTKERS